MSERKYHIDFALWSERQAEALRQRADNEIDWENVAEEIESLGRSDKREIRNRLAVICERLSLNDYATIQLRSAYARERMQAARETGIADLPATCPWTIEQVLDPDFLVGELRPGNSASSEP